MKADKVTFPYNTNDRGDSHGKNMMLFSSPVKESPGNRNVLNDLHEVQMERSRKLYKPFSSPIRGSDTDSSGLSSPIKYSNQEFPNGHQGIINNRNKHSKLRATRNQYKQDKIMLQRNRTHELQTKGDTENQYNREIDQLNLDIDTLIEEERDTDGYDACVEEYENELEDWELQQELEMIELMSQLEVGDHEVGDHDVIANEVLTK